MVDGSRGQKNGYILENSEEEVFYYALNLPTGIYALFLLSSASRS